VSTNRFSHKRKVHLFFGVAFLAVITISVVINSFAGHTLLSSVVDAFRQIKPLEYLMFFLVWYWIARDQQTNPRPTITSLNIGGSST
jgi:hypothetical protein